VGKPDSQGIETPVLPLRGSRCLLLMPPLGPGHPGRIDPGPWNCPTAIGRASLSAPLFILLQHNTQHLALVVARLYVQYRMYSLV